MNKVTPFLMFNEQVEAAIEFHTSTFPDPDVRNVARAGSDGLIRSAEWQRVDQAGSTGYWRYLQPDRR